MPREKRKAALKAIKYTEDPPVDSEDEDVDVGSASGSGTGRKRKAVRASVDEDDWCGGDEDDEPKKKKRKAPAKSTNKGKGRGRQGKLSAFNAMPLDVLYCIAQDLDPLTLLNMSRANKAMHSLLASRSSLPIWQAVRRAVFLPDLTAPDMTEMRYASLMFERNCHLCGRGRASIVDHSLRIRWCKNCQRGNLLPRNKISYQLDYLDDAAFECSLTTEHSPSGRNWSKKAYYCKHDVEQISNEITALKDEIAAAKGKVKRSEAAAALDDFVRERKAIVKASKKDAEELSKWERSDATSRKKASNDARAARKQAIEDRLVALGYEERDTKHLYNVWQLVDQPTPLTDAIWSRISVKIIQAAEDNKTSRLERDKRARQATRRSDVRPYYDQVLADQEDDVALRFPSFMSFAQLPSVLSFWFDDGNDISSASWEAALPDINKDVVKAMRVIKVNYARSALGTHRSVDVAVDDDLVRRLEATPSSQATQPTYDPYGIHLGGGDYELRTSKLDLDDSAPDVTDAELDGLLTRLIGQFYCSAYGCNSVLPFPECHAHARGHSLPATGKSTALSMAVVALLRDGMKQTGFEDEVASMEKMEALGAVWNCERCKENLRRYGWSYQPAAPPCQGLTWSEMIAHNVNHHLLANHLTPDRPEAVLSAAGVALLPESTKERRETLQREARLKDAELRAAAAEKRAKEREAQEREDRELQKLIEMAGKTDEELLLDAQEEADEEMLDQMERELDAAAYAEMEGMDEDDDDDEDDE